VLQNFLISRKGRPGLLPGNRKGEFRSLVLDDRRDECHSLGAKRQMLRSLLLGLMGRLRELSPNFGDGLKDQAAT
jgi:hypothetical protein